jgi:enoyl-CoA hydratase/carnithine racemase
MNQSAASSTARDAGEVTVGADHGVATIEFGHPKSNSLPGPLLRRLADAVDRAACDDGARVIVVRSTGSGPFCAGASFEELKGLTDAAAGQEFFMGFARLILAMRRCPKLIIARVHGKAVGGGVGVVAAADYAVATATASVRLSELAIGIGPFVVGPVIERKIGRGAFQALAVDAATWRDAAWAERHGLFAQVVADDEALDAAVGALARRLASSSPEAMARLKSVFWDGTEDWDTLLEARAAMSGALVLSPAARRAIAAFAAR